MMAHSTGRKAVLASLLCAALLALRPTVAQGCGGEGQSCCEGSTLTCQGQLFCDAPRCLVETSKCWRLPTYPDECGVAGKPCCPLFKCTDGSRWPKDYPSGGRYDGFACMENAVCDYGADSSKGWTTTLCKPSAATAGAQPGSAGPPAPSPIAAPPVKASAGGR